MVSNVLELLHMVLHTQAWSIGSAKLSIQQLLFSGGCRIELKGFFVATSRAKLSRPRPLSIKTTPSLEHLGEKLLVLPVNPSVFDRDF